MVLLSSIEIEIGHIIKGIREILQNQRAVIAFSGGMDSTVVLHLAKIALGSDMLTAANIEFGIFTYQQARKNVESITHSLQIKLTSISGEKEQAAIMKHGPDCNLCTRKAKLALIKNNFPQNVILTGSNQSDSWGSYGLAFHSGYYAPLLNYKKDTIEDIARYLGISIKRIGENNYREGCKLKHLLKPMVNKEYHGLAVSKANEILLSRIKEDGFFTRIANVKVMGPLSKNIALVNIDPMPSKKWLAGIKNEIEKLAEIEECQVVDKPLEILIKANKGQFNNMRSRYWIEKGRLQPEFTFPLQCKWLLTTNHRLKTFQVVDYNI